MSSELDILIKDILSPINSIRKTAEQKFNFFYENMTIKDFDSLLNELTKSSEDNIKIFICVIIKKFISEKISQNNQEIFIEYFSTNKIKFINILLTANTSTKLIKNLLDCLLDSLYILKSNENIYIDNIYDIFSIFAQYYINKKQANEITNIFQCLFICKKFIKFMQKVTVNKKLEDSIIAFYSNIIQDYQSIINNITNNNLNEVFLESIIYYLKLFKHSYIFMNDSYNDKILNNTYDLNVYILNQLITNNIKTENNISKFIFDIIFLSNKIIILYISQLNSLSIQTLSKYSEMFYIYIKEENIFNYINFILQNNNNINDNTENKFLLDIINFFYEILQLSSLQEFTSLQIFGNGFSDNSIEVSDFFCNKFWDKEKLKNLILFILKNYFTFKKKEIIMGLHEPEEFYLWFYNSDAYQYDLRGKAGKVCRIIYDVYRKDIKDIYISLENELYSLTETEYNLIQKNQKINDNQINIKLALLSYYYYVDNHFGSKNLKKEKWLKQILLSQIDVNIIKKKSEIFSTFLIMYILNKINSYISDSKIKYSVFIKIMEVFLCKDFDYLLLDLSSIDYIYDYIEEETNKIELPKNLINNYLIKICQLLEKISSPDIHNKIIETTNCLLSKVNDDNLNLNFPEIFPVLQKIWENNSNELNQNYSNANKLILIRSNLIKLIELFVKKVGFFIAFDENKNFYENYFNFLFQIIGYSINVNSKSSEFLCKSALNLMIFIQDDFIQNSSLSIISDINSLNSQLNTLFYFPYFIKTYQYLDILLSNLSNSNQYFIVQFAAIEQFISFSFEQEISIILEKINFVDKIIYIWNYFLNNYINEYNLYLFNDIEYIYYIMMTYSKISEENKKKLNDFIYNVIQNKLGDNNFENEINKIMNKYEQNFDDIFFGRDDDIYLINIYIGIIQLANRYIYINASIYKNINNNINIFIAKKIISLSNFLTKKNKILNIIQKVLLKNCIFNLKNLINDNDINNALNYIYNQITKSHFLSKNDKILNHWLFFFNKIYNEFYTSRLDSDEENLRYYWKNLVEKDVLLIDNDNKDYKIKFLMLASDFMYNNEE